MSAKDEVAHDSIDLSAETVSKKRSSSEVVPDARLYSSRGDPDSEEPGSDETDDD